MTSSARKSHYTNNWKPQNLENMGAFAVIVVSAHGLAPLGARTSAGMVMSKFDAVYSWWRHQMETFSTLLALCKGNPPVTNGFPSQRPVTRSMLSKQSRRWWFETPSRSLWHHRNAWDYYMHSSLSVYIRDLHFNGYFQFHSFLQKSRVCVLNPCVIYV